jgi:hypothetical protein
MDFLSTHLAVVLRLACGNSLASVGFDRNRTESLPEDCHQHPSKSSIIYTHDAAESCLSPANFIVKMRFTRPAELSSPLPLPDFPIR